MPRKARRRAHSHVDGRAHRHAYRDAHRGRSSPRPNHRERGNLFIAHFFGARRRRTPRVPERIGGAASEGPRVRCAVGYAQIDTGRRRSPSACSETFVFKKRARRSSRSSRHPHFPTGPTHGAASEPCMRRQTHRRVHACRISEHAGGERRGPLSMGRYPNDATFFFKKISPSTPTANAEGLCRSGGTSRRVSPRLFRRHPPIR